MNWAMREALKGRTVTDTDSYAFFRINHNSQREDDRGSTNIMRRIIFFLLIFSAFAANARQITSDEAKAIASEFLNSTPKYVRTGKNSPPMRPLSTAAQSERSTKPQPFYIFNADSDGGFVIVSGDTRLTKILGYSDSGNIDANNMPPQLKSLLDEYENQFIATSDCQEETAVMNKETSDEVLLKTANWNQTAPYNAKCPISDNHPTLTGCVPTAMAIVMKYHNWPDIGRGHHKIPCNDGFIGQNEIEFDFTKNPFDYSLMLDEYTIDSPEEKIQEVAKLMIAAGAACHANYGEEETGASTTFMLRGFVYNLKYSPEITTIYIKGAFPSESTLNSYYTQEEFEFIIKEQLKSGLPVLGETYNHCLILDGYDRNGKFHFNFGWGGGANGYYTLPEKYILSATINIKPDKSGVNVSQAYLRNNDLSTAASFPEFIDTYPWLNISTTRVNKGEAFDCVSGVIYLPVGFCGEYGLAVMDKNYNLREILWSKKVDFSADWYTHSVHIDVHGLMPKVEIREGDIIQIVTKNKADESYAIVPATRQVESSAPCVGYEPKYTNLEWLSVSGKQIEGWSYSDDYRHSQLPSELPDKILKGAAINLCLTKEFDIRHLDNFDYRYVIDVNGQARRVCSNRVTPLHFMDDKAKINIEMFSESELKSRKILVNETNSIQNQINSSEAYRIEDLTVEGVLTEQDMEYIDNTFAFLKNINMKSCAIPENKITNKFMILSQLESIVLPNSLSFVDEYAFDYSNNLKSVYLPSSVSFIGYEAFGRCEQLTDVWLENPILDTNSLDYAAFYECYDRCVLHVPFSAVDSCKESPFYMRFKDIVGFTIPEKEEIIVTHLSLSDDVNTKPGATVMLNAVIHPVYATNKTLKWKSEDKDVAMISPEGLLYAKNKGSTKIIVRTTDGSDIEAHCHVIVDDASGINEVQENSDTRVRIYNIQGKLVFEGNRSDAKLDRGIYIIVCQNKKLKQLIK